MELEVVTVLEEPSRSLTVKPVDVTSVTVPPTVGTRTRIIVTAKVPSAFFFWARLIVSPTLRSESFPAWLPTRIWVVSVTEIVRVQPSTVLRLTSVPSILVIVIAPPKPPTRWPMTGPPAIEGPPLPPKPNHRPGLPGPIPPLSPPGAADAAGATDGSDADSARRRS